MVLTLQIDKVRPGLYRAAALTGAIEVTEPGTYGSIEEAIRQEAAAVPPHFAHFFEIRYAGVSSGTLPLGQLPERAADIANQLVAIVAEMHRIEGR